MSITGDCLAVSAEKKTVLAFDSLHPVDSMDDEEQKDSKVRSMSSTFNLYFLFKNHPRPTYSIV